MEPKGKPHILFRNLKIRTRFFITAALFFSVLIFIACEKKESSRAHSVLYAEKEQILKIPDNHIVLFLGHIFPDEDEKKSVIGAIAEKYGFMQNGGIISVLSYPEDVSVAGRIRMSSLTAKVQALHEEKPLSAFITVAAPQGMHTVLAALQDSGMHMPVFSLFPQDDVLGTEAGSDLVIDYRHATAGTAAESGKTAAVKNADAEAIEKAEADETGSFYTGDFCALLKPLIYAALRWEHVKDDAMFIPSLRMEFLNETNCNLVIYTDSATGLRSKNRYVLEEIPKEKK